MSGLFGWMGESAGRPAAASRALEMRRALAQGADEPGESGEIFEPGVSARLGWNHRSYEAPMVGWNDTRDLCLVFAGEDFDLPANAARLSHRTEGLSPAEVLVRLFEKIGPKAVASVNGRFCGALLDTRNRTINLFNDRFGLNRIYCAASSDGFHFSTTAKSLLAVLPAAREIDERGLGEFFSVGCVLQNRSLFRGITLLPPGSWWTIHPDGSVKDTRYFDARVWEEQSKVSAEEYTRQLIDVFGRIAPKYLGGDAPVGMSLTGGLDSRMILAWVRARENSLPCYTFGGPYRDCADVTIARKLARLAKQPHTTLPIGSDFFPEFPALAEKTVLASDGTMDVSGAVELYANHRARQIAPVRVTGNYGSEILRANVAFRPARLDRSLFTPAFNQRLDEAGETYRSEAAGHRLSFIAFKQVPWHHYSRFAAEYSKLTPRSPFLDNELVALAYRAPRELEGSPAPILKLIAAGNPALDIDSDRALRARSIPIYSTLRHAWQEFTAKAEYAYDYGMPAPLVKIDRYLRPLHLENLFLGRHKFYHFRIWYRRQLATALRELHAASEAPGCYRAGVSEALIDEHTRGRSNRTSEIHKLLTVQLLKRTMIASACNN